MWHEPFLIQGEAHRGHLTLSRRVLISHFPKAHNSCFSLQWLRKNYFVPGTRSGENDPAMPAGHALPSATDPSGVSGPFLTGMLGPKHAHSPSRDGAAGGGESENGYTYSACTASRADPRELRRSGTGTLYVHWIPIQNMSYFCAFPSHKSIVSLLFNPS